MLQQAAVIARARPWWVTLIILVAMAMAAQWAAAQTPDSDYEEGNYCLADVSKQTPTCTANDVRIASMSPSIEEACLAVGDHATVKFTVELDSGANERYDVSVFVATDGGSALNGDSCYHDFLQEGSTVGPWDVLGGYGLFYELEANPDVCADIRQNELTYYTFQKLLTIPCIDANLDGVVDPISTCTGWHNVAKVDCTDVKGADIDVPSKCTCQAWASDPPILVYTGYDWGDLPDTYGTYTASSGARHTVQDPTLVGTPQTQGGVPAVWLGPTIDYSPIAESDGQPNEGATGDDAANVDDEDGVAAAGFWSVENGGQISVNVSSSDGTCTGCRLGFWIDWDGSGTFDAGESYVEPVVHGLQMVAFEIPVLPSPPLVYARFRLYDGNYTGTILPTGVVTNGEVEDYLLDITPTAVTLAWFEATDEGDAILLSWKTASELDNLGFNLYRGESPDAPSIKLNNSLLPSEAPGSLLGHEYSYPDDTANPGITYYYWLETIDLRMVATRYGPVAATILTPSVMFRVFLPLVVR